MACFHDAFTHQQLIDYSDAVKPEPVNATQTTQNPKDFFAFFSFSFMCTDIPHACLVAMRTRRGHLVPWNLEEAVSYHGGARN